MLMRTGMGGQYKSVSQDGGETWTEPAPTTLTGTAAPVSISRIPSTGDLLAIWNNNLGKDRPGNVGRTPLTAAISKDEGETWEGTAQHRGTARRCLGLSCRYLGRRSRAGHLLQLLRRSLPPTQDPAQVVVLRPVGPPSQVVTTSAICSPQTP